MKCELINNRNILYSPIEQVLYNRGIKPEDFNNYLKTSETVVNSWDKLDTNELRNIANTICKTIAKNSKITIVIDSDCDGFTSAALLANYLYFIFPNWTKNNLKFMLHCGKQHGLTDCYQSLLQLNDIDVIILPDSSSEDYSYHEELSKASKIVCVLDHHPAKRKSEYAYVVNNQICDYPNKQLSGVGIVWQFCRYLDFLLGEEYAYHLTDLLALGLVGDMMSLCALETKYLINLGINNIKNPFISNMIEKNSYIMKGKVTPINLAFYVVPYVNSITRSGTVEENYKLFCSMLNYKAYELVDCTKRGSTDEKETLIVQVLRLVEAVKRRQTKKQNEGLELLEQKIIDDDMLKNNVLVFLLKPDEIDRNIGGLIANKLMSKYQKSCCILIESEDGTNYSGSARGYTKTGLISFKDKCEETRDIEWARGHKNAFGLLISKNKIQDFIKHINKLIITDKEIKYQVDFEFLPYNIDINIINEIAQYDNLWGQEMDEPLIYIPNIILRNNFIFYQKKNITLKISLKDIEIIAFNIDEQTMNQIQNNQCTISIVGRCGLNEFNGNVTPQIIIEDFELQEDKTIIPLF